ncbi:hypothetical protein Gasu2_08630 [Galdieria sulphuraria]|uniref:TOG domain-containing protein n=1 Tax=Galdieria sulphuraria TaxID=130081 RepID=M2XV27_GALSU|nr:uncharacterized protein Gasu_49470 [Galdieria sulphuraria]EME27498.1 hypothetical protein Gasu_49470 [Galdieria sulphuraria]GJD06447.1 hypothetical protein Gasu2_08630 [Galdieria sulphuraria]|eukprot:XP_005704018.1 hypothetical protein Gasu_49470 [Galdieria sulphuraria]
MFRRNSTNDVSTKSQKNKPSNKAMGAISRLAKRFQRKKQEDGVISVLVTTQQRNGEDDAVATNLVNENGRVVSHTNSEGQRKRDTELEEKKQQERAFSEGIERAPCFEETQDSLLKHDRQKDDNGGQSFTFAQPQLNESMCADEILCENQQKRNIGNDSAVTQIHTNSFHNTENAQTVEQAFSDSNISQITNPSSQFAKTVDNSSNEHTNSSGRFPECPDSNHFCEKKSKRRSRTPDLQADKNSEKDHVTKKESQTTELTKRKSKNSVEAPASPISFTRYPWEEPGYSEGSGISQTISESELTKETSEWLTILATLESEWTHRVAALKRIRLTLTVALNNNCQNVIEIFSAASLRNALIIQTTDLRSSLVKEAFETIATICEKLGNLRDFFLTSALFLDKAVLLAIVKTTKVIAKPAEECGKRIVASTAAEAVLPVLCSTIRFGVHPTAREKCTLFLLHILKRGCPLVRHTQDISNLVAKNYAHETSPKEIRGLQYSISEFTSEDSGLRSLESALASAIGDSHGSTREAGLNCLHEMEKHWPERTQGLIQALDPSLRRRALSSLSSNSSQSTKSSAASSNRARKSVREWKAEAQKTRKNLENASVFSEEHVVIAEDSIADNAERTITTGQESHTIPKHTLSDTIDIASGIEHRSSKKTETRNSIDTNKVRNSDSLRVR